MGAGRQLVLLTRSGYPCGLTIRSPSMSQTDSPEHRSADLAKRQSVWSDYWAGGALHSCAGSFAGNYEGPIADFWRALLEELAPGSRLLEVCCGNAPLAKWICDHTQLLQQGATLEATDLAQVSPSWLTDLPSPLRQQIHLSGGVDATALPFAEQSFDLAMSQYGIEYVGQAGLGELARVLRPGGKIAAIVHHQNALPPRYGRAELDALRWLRRERGLFDLAAQLIEPMARSRSAEGLVSLRGDAQAAEVRAAFNAELRQLQSRQADPLQAALLDDVAQRMLRLMDLARTQGLEAAERELQTERQRWQAAELRQQELVDCALDEAGLRALVGLPTLRIETLRPIEFGHQGLAGWALVLQREQG